MFDENKLPLVQQSMCMLAENLTEDQINSITSAYIVQTAAAYGYTISTGEEAENFVMALYGLTIDEYANLVIAQYLLETYIEQNYAEYLEAVPGPTEEQILQLYNDNLDTFEAVAAARVAHIFMQFGEKESDNAAVLSTMQSIKKRIDSGELTFEKAAADYARSKGVVLKGDLPIGVNRDSVETLQHPELFHMDSQTGAPPDGFSRLGQNWGFPTYNWLSAEPTPGAHRQPPATMTDWFRQRLKHMEQYFDALRIDHVLGFFRIWEIPADAVYGVMGHFSPALPLTVSEIEYFGLPFRKKLFTKPFINDRLVDRLFGIHAQYVRDTFLVRKAYGLYDLQPDYDTQRKVAAQFADRCDESSLWIRDGLMLLIANVLFVEDPRQPEMYHPRIGVLTEPIYEALSAEEKDAFLRLYNNYFYQRHSFFWGQNALRRLPAVLKDCRMLVCAEDLGMLPDCVEPVLDELRILTLEIQQMPKQQGFEFAHLEANPIRSVCTISTHDMAPLRLWWKEQPERRQRYYVTMLQKEGRAPEQLPAHLAEEIIARHLYCHSMLCILQLQDWLAMDSELRRKNIQEERINVPSDPYNRWQYRMHLTIEELLEATKYNHKVKTMIQRSKR